jgi:hypothetical protein
VSKNRMSDLRNHLFETLEKLKDPEEPLDIERAKAICQVAGTIIESAKTEVKYAEVVGALPDATFFEQPPKLPGLPVKSNGHATTN